MTKTIVNPECVGVLEGHHGSVLNAKFTANGVYCMSTSHDKSIILWNPIKCLAIKEYKGPHNHEVNDVSITTDNSRFATCGGDKFAFLWDVTSGDVIRKFGGHDGKIYCCEIAADNSLLLTGCYDKHVRIFDLKASSTVRPIQSLTEAKDAVSSILVTNDSKIITTSVDGYIRCYDIRKGKLYTDKLSAPAVRSVLSHDERCIAVNCLDNTIQFLEVDSGQHLNVLRGHKNTNYSLNCQMDISDNYIISGSEDGRIIIWDICAQQGEFTQVLSASTTSPAVSTNDEPQHLLNDPKQSSFHQKRSNVDWGCVFTIRFHPTQWLFLSCHNDKTLRIWKKQ